jgi:hypothetical protein
VVLDKLHTRKEGRKHAHNVERWTLVIGTIANEVQGVQEDA